MNHHNLMMPSTDVLCVSVLAVVWYACAVSQGQEVSGEFLRFRRNAASAPYRTVETVIDTNGTAVVALADAKQQIRRRSFRLSPDEFSAFEHLIDAVNAFGQPVADPQSAGIRVSPEYDTLRVWITKHGETRALDLPDDGSRGRLSPLLDQLSQLNRLAVVLDELEYREDSIGYAQDTGPSAVMRPRALIGPLQELVARSTNHVKLGSAFAALARLQTETEWIGFVSKCLAEADGERQNLLLYVLTGNPHRARLSEERIEALLPLFLQILRQPESMGALSKDRSEALSSVCHLLMMKQCRAAESTLKLLKERSPDWKLTATIGDMSWLRRTNSPQNSVGRRIDSWRDPYEYE